MKHILLFGVGWQHFKQKKMKFYFHPGKLVTSLAKAYIFTMEKALVKIIFGRKILIFQLISKIFVALFWDVKGQ